MPLPRVHVKLTADGQGEVWLNDSKIPAVIAVDISGAVGEQPTVTVTVIPGEVTVDLPEAGVQLIGAGPSLAAFVEQLNPARLEALALEGGTLEGGTLDVTTGEAFAAAVQQLAAEFEQATSA